AILAGSGVHTSGAHATLAHLAERLGAGVATTIHGKGALPSDSPWLVGVVGNNGGLPAANAYLRDADAVLLVGTRANATDTNSWTGPARTGTPVAQIDIEPARAGRNFPDAVPLAGDADAVLRQLTDLLDAAPEAELAERRAAVTRARALPEPTPYAGSALLPEDVVRTINRIVPPD
ncbi:thiamine pyrophosphate-binding protein, partial [Streptomyces hainanensis]